MKINKIILLFALFFITGCSEEKLICTTSQEEKGIMVTTSNHYKYKDDKLVDFWIEVKASPTTEAYHSMWNFVVSSLDSKYNNMNFQNIKVKTTNDIDKYLWNAKIYVDIDKVTEEELENVGLEYFLEKGKFSITKTKEYNKKQEYTCK